MQAKQWVRKAPNGFTLIELMIVIAIIGVLAMVAVPQYRDYLIRTKVVEGLNLATVAKLAVSETIAAKGSDNIDQAATGYAFEASPELKTVANIEVANGGVIIITYGDIGGDADKKTLKLVPVTTNPSAITWTCLAQPSGASAATNADAGTLPAKYAPASCRS